jgi:integrase/recombinase XerD
VPDIDSRNMTVLIRCGKGNKQRLVPLSHGLLKELRNWWRQHRDPSWLFPGKIPGRPMTISAVQRALKV